MFRSGILTQARVNQIVKRAEATPHNLRIVAKACSVLPQDLLAWFAAGQDPACKFPLMVELAWRINGLRADVAARNYARIEAAANGGKKTKTVTKPNPYTVENGVESPELKPVVEVTVEDVLPAAWAIEKIDALAAASHWEISPDAQQAEELHRMMQELTPTPLLTEGEPPMPIDDPSDGGEGDLAGVDDPERPGAEADAAAGAMPEAPGSLAGGHAAILPVELGSGVDEAPGLDGRAGAVDQRDNPTGPADVLDVHDQSLTGPE